MTTTNGWPSKPGKPLNPERDGWHWVKARPEKLRALRKKFPALWTADNQHWIRGTYPSEYAAENWTYLGPCLTPDEVTKREDAKWHEGYAVGVLDVRRGTAFGEPDPHYATLQKRVAELKAVLDFYACIDHYQTHNAAAPNVVQVDRGAKARAALTGGKDE